MDYYEQRWQDRQDRECERLRREEFAKPPCGPWERDEQRRQERIEDRDEED